VSPEGDDGRKGLNEFDISAPYLLIHDKNHPSQLYSDGHENAAM
jgi:hypothetical protein